VLSADNGLTGVEMARHHQPDLIVMDVSIPGMSGWDAEPMRVVHDVQQLLAARGPA